MRDAQRYAAKSTTNTEPVRIVTAIALAPPTTTAMRQAGAPELITLATRTSLLISALLTRLRRGNMPRPAVPIIPAMSPTNSNDGVRNATPATASAAPMARYTGYRRLQMLAITQIIGAVVAAP